MNLLLILFRIVINKSYKILAIILEKLFNDLEDEVCEKISKKVVRKLLRNRGISKKRDIIRF